MSTATFSPADPFDAGPYARLLARMHLGRTGSRTAVDVGLFRRAVVFAAIAWVPLVILGAFEGLALGPTPRESVLLDLAGYGRYVIALPLLIAAEGICLPQLSAIAHEFGHGGLIPESQQSRYEGLIASTRGLLERRWIEVLLALVAYVLAMISSEAFYPRGISSWVAPIGVGGQSLSLAGWWRLLVSQPLFLAIVVAWLWRIALWFRFLWVVSHLDLQLVPSHPDQTGGLRFLALSLRGFRWFAAGLGAATAGAVSHGYFFDHRPIKSFQPTVVSLVVVILILCVGPLLVFYRPLFWARAEGVMQYGKLAASLGRQFEHRWLKGNPAVGAEALSQPDFSATTDLFSIVGNVYNMTLIPFQGRALLPLVLAALAPFLPLVLAILPVKDLLQYATKVLL